MYNFSNDFKNALYSDNRKFKVIMNLTLKDSTEIEITEADIWAGTMNVESSTSASGIFSVGALVANKLTFALNNLYDKFSIYDFIDATMGVFVGAELPDGSVEFERYGFYIVTESTVSENSITIVAWDNLSKLNHEYVGGIKYPATLTEIVKESCLACGVLLDAGSIPPFMNTFKVKEEPNKAITYAGMISNAAQISGCFARADHQGRLAFEWYPMHLLNEKADGGTFKYDGKAEDGTPEAELDGGSFTDYSSGDDYEGGTFRELTGYHVINSTTSASISTDNVIITGVSVTSQPLDPDIEPDTTLVGSEGYIYVVNGNPFIQAGQSEVVANQIYESIGGMLFRPLTISILPDPSIEAGDVGLVADIHNNYYPCFFSSVSFKPDSDGTIVCDAQSANRHSAKSENAMSTVLQQSKEWIAHEKTSRTLAIEDLSNLMSNALGFYSSDVIQPDGSVIKYLHNKRNLTDSNIQWKITIDGVAVSTNYGQTWSTGWTSEGNMVASTLSVVGINCDWLEGGTIKGQYIEGGEINGAQIYGDYLINKNPDDGYMVMVTKGVLSFHGQDGTESVGLYYRMNNNSKKYTNLGLCIANGKEFQICAFDSKGVVSGVFNFNNSNGVLGVSTNSNVTVSFASRPKVNGTNVALSSELSGFAPKNHSHPQYAYSYNPDFDGVPLASRPNYSLRLSDIDAEAKEMYGELRYYATGSSKRFKHDIKDVENDELNPERLYDLPIHQFVYNEDFPIAKDDKRYNRELIGFIVEEMNEIYPCAVDHDGDNCVDWDVNYIIPPMLSLIQKQHKEIEGLKDEINKLKEVVYGNSNAKGLC